MSVGNDGSIDREVDRTCKSNDQREARTSNQRPFQGRVVDWMMETFSMEVCRNTTERNHRFLEEALELVQAMGCTAAEAHMLVDYTFGRPVGDPEQEVGGALVTLAALCSAADISMAELGERELARCWQNIDRIRAKQAGKPRYSPLPGTTPDETTERREKAWLVESGAAAPHTEYRYMDQFGFHWTKDINKAIRFARREDAEMAAAGDDDAWSIVEHEWVTPGSPLEPSRCTDCGVSLVPQARHFSGCKSHPGEPAVKAT